VTNKFILPVFWSLVGLFVIARGVGFIPYMGFWSLAISGFIFWLPFFLLGLTLLILVVRADIDKTFKKFLILTASSAVGLFVSIILHNLVFGLFTQWFGEDFWERSGIGDEPFFFMMAIFICPIAYLIGAVGSIVVMMRRKTRKTSAV